MPPATLLTIYCCVILLASLAGGWVPLLMRMTHKRMELAVSLVAGFMLGVGLLHLLPHALAEAGSDQAVIHWLLAGFLTMFFTERFLCFHHHDAPTKSIDAETDKGCCDHTAAHGHRLTWTGVAFGMVLHSVIAGVALAASIDAQSHTPSSKQAAGLAVFLVIVLHKPFDSMTLGTLMAAGRWSGRWRHAVNALFALAVPVGALMHYAGLSALAGESHTGTAFALAFSAGAFLCISLSDLLPELQFHQHDRIKLSAALLIGLAIAWGVGKLEHQTHTDVHRHDLSTQPEATHRGHAHP